MVGSRLPPPALKLRKGAAGGSEGRVDEEIGYPIGSSIGHPKKKPPGRRAAGGGELLEGEEFNSEAIPRWELPIFEELSARKLHRRCTNLP